MLNRLLEARLARRKTKVRFDTPDKIQPFAVAFRRDATRRGAPPSLLFKLDRQTIT